MRCPTSNFGTKLSLARLLDSAANLRKHIVGIRPDESDRAHDDDENHCQHHRVFLDVLTTLIRPELLQKSCHGLLAFSFTTDRTPSQMNRGCRIRTPTSLFPRLDLSH